MVRSGNHHHWPNYHSMRIKQPNIEEAPEEARPPTGASRLGVLVWRGTTTSTPLSYYNLTATLWGYSGQPLESLLGVILVPRHPGGTPSPRSGIAGRVPSKRTLSRAWCQQRKWLWAHEPERDGPATLSGHNVTSV